MDWLVCLIKIKQNKQLQTENHSLKKHENKWYVKHKQKDKELNKRANENTIVAFCVYCVGIKDNGRQSNMNTFTIKSTLVAKVQGVATTVAATATSIQLNLFPIFVRKLNSE